MQPHQKSLHQSVMVVLSGCLGRCKSTILICLVVHEVSHAVTMLVAKGNFHVRKSPPALCRRPEQQ